MNTLLTDQHTNLLASAQIGHMATSDSKGVPRIIPVCFVEVSGNIYSMIDKKPKVTDMTKLKRLQNILSYPNDSFLIDHYEEDWDNLWYLQINGKAALIDTPHSEMHDQLIRKYPPYTVMNVSHQPLIRIIPESINLWVNNN